MSTETYQEASYFFNNIKEIIKNDDLIVKFKKNTIRTKATILKWIRSNKHKVTDQSSIATKWKVGIPSSFVPGRKGSIWIDLTMDDGQNVRIFLYLKKNTKKLFQSYTDKNYMIIVRNLDTKLDILYQGCNTELLNKITTPTHICRLNKPLFTGASYNRRYVII